MRNHRVFLVGSTVLATVLLAGYGFPGQTSPKNENQSGAQKAAQSAQAQMSSGNPVENGAAPTLDMKTLESVLVSRMHLINQLEIKAGKMASEKGSRFDIRQFGDRLRRDHTVADRMVLAYANKHNLPILAPNLIAQKMQTIPSSVPVTEVFPVHPQNQEAQASIPGAGLAPYARAQVFLEQVHQAQQMMQKLQGMQGSAFDAMFTQFTITGHARAIGTLSLYRGMLPHNGLRAMLGKMIPILEQHYDIASRLHIATVRRENSAVGQAWSKKYEHP